MTAPLASLADYGTHDESARPELWVGCVGAWCPSLGPTGERLHDFSRLLNWGALTNMDPSTDWVVDGGGYAIDFDGSNDMVEAAGLGIDGLFSVSAWVKTSASVRQTIVNQLNYVAESAIEQGWTIDMLSTGKARCTVTSGPSSYRFADSTTSINDGRWHHVGLLRRESNTVSVVVDGKIEATNSGSIGSIGSIANAVTLQIGGESDRGDTFGPFCADWLGCIDNVMAWDRPLNSEEWRTLALRRAIAFERELLPVLYVTEEAASVLYWTFARRSGQIIGGGI